MNAPAAAPIRYPVMDSPDVGPADLRRINSRRCATSVPAFHNSSTLHKRLNEVRPLFFQLAELDSDMRTSRLEALSDCDPELKQQLWLLLAAHDQTDQLLGRFEDLILRATTVDPLGLIGKAVAQYEIRDLLGTGGMGVLYEATDTRLGRSVALKFIRPHLTTPEIRQRFEREIRITSRLQHPNILPLYDAGVAGDVLYYVMPYVRGESLRQRLERDSTLPEREVLQIGRDVASALAYAHQHDVIHRDIKPGNIMLTSNRAVVADFGISKVLEPDTHTNVTESGALVGTRAYMSPEQYRGEATGRTDIYALGAVLYRLLTGRRWSLGTPVHEADWSGVNPEMRPALAGALRASPQNRWVEAGAFREAMGHAATRRLWQVCGDDSPAPTRLRANVDASEFRSSIAVLPLANRSVLEEDVPFVDGIHDDILTHLSRIEGLKVVSRTSVLKYRRFPKPVRAIARELDVATVLEGGVQRAGERVRVNVQLIDARSDANVWAETYDKELKADRIFATQADIALRIAEALRTTLLPEAEPQIEVQST